MDTTYDESSNQDAQFDLEPWHEPVVPEQLYLELRICIDRFLILTPQQIASIPLWILHTYFIRSPGVPQVFSHSPILAINSPEKQCGKSRLLEIIADLVHHPLVAMDATSAAIYRTIERSRPTLLLDEFDNFDVNKKSLLALLNSGYKQDGKSIRQGGKNFEETLEFSTWSAKLLAGIGGLPDTLQSRCIMIKMRRRLPSEVVDSRNSVLRDDPNYFIDLRRKMIRFVIDFEHQIISSTFVPPQDMDDRAQDNWLGLFKIAECIGAEQLQFVIDAAKVLSAPDEDKPSIGVELLRDIQPFLDETQATHIPTVNLLEYLLGLEDRPWKTHDGKGLTPYLLSKLLEPFGIKPQPAKHDSKAVRGYWDEELRDAIARYL